MQMFIIGNIVDSNFLQASRATPNTSQTMLRTIIKFNGYAVAIVCFQFCLMAIVQFGVVEVARETDCEGK